MWNQGVFAKSAMLLTLASPVSLAGPAQAHVSEQVLSLLLPTGIYTAAGVAAVLVSVLISAGLKPHVLHRLFSTFPLPGLRAGWLSQTAGLAGFALFVFAVWSGLAGPTDPLANFMPLYVWTLVWLLLPVVQLVFGDVWATVNPWTGLFRLMRGPEHGLTRREVSPAIGAFVALAGFGAVYLFVLADPAPDQPQRLVNIAGGWWLFHFAMMWCFGRSWLSRAEAVTVFMTQLSRLSVLGATNTGNRFGLVGWKLANAAPPATGLAVFVIVMLGAGSYDGMNETFWWLAKIGVNPLSFPGRSAIIAPTVLGFFAAEFLLLVVFTAVAWFGWRLAGHGPQFPQFWKFMALSLLPIAAGYHIAHYLTAFLVNGQYLVAAMSDPLARGDDLLGLGKFYVTTGFFNQTHTVRIIFLTQAGAVVVGHILAVLLSHFFALKLYGARRAALISQLPMIVFMIAYTFLGLWLLASPRGL